MAKTPIAVLGIDLGKNSCSVAGLDMNGAVVLQRKMTRETLVAFASKLPACIVAMEACGGAHFLGRTFAAQRHTVRLMSPEYVQPYVKSQKTDDPGRGRDRRGRDTTDDAPCDAEERGATRSAGAAPGTRATGHGADQADQSVARGAARAGRAPAETPSPTAASTARAHGGGTAISPRVVRLLQDLCDEWASLDARISSYDDAPR